VPHDWLEASPPGPGLFSPAAQVHGIAGFRVNSVVCVPRGNGGGMDVCVWLCPRPRRDEFGKKQTPPFLLITDLHSVIRAGSLRLNLAV
jgi:hypothetical protein